MRYSNREGDCDKVELLEDLERSHKPQTKLATRKLELEVPGG